MHTTEFNMVEVWSVMQKRWKFIAAFVAASLLVALITLMFVPKYYRSTVVVVAANPQLSDKARLFNPNIEALYSNFGSTEDLDRLYGLANLDTSYKLLVDEFGLIKYYNIGDGDAALKRRKAVLNLRDDVELMKTDINQLKISVWTKNPELSAKMANRMAEIVHLRAKGIWRDTYKNALANLEQAVADLEHQVDSINQLMMVSLFTPEASELVTNKRTALLEQVKEYYKAINEYQLVVANDPPALYVTETAYPSAKSDKPKKLPVLFAVLFASVAFAVIAVLLQNKKPAMHVA